MTDQQTSPAAGRGQAVYDQEITLSKEEIYQSLAVINDSLKQTVEHLQKLKEAKVLPARLTTIHCATFEQRKSEISHLITSRMNERELEDSGRLEKQCLALEEELRQMDAKLQRKLERKLKRNPGPRKTKWPSGASPNPADSTGTWEKPLRPLGKRKA